MLTEDKETGALRGWCLCASQKEMHYFKNAGDAPMCKAVLKPTEKFRPSLGVKGKPVSNAKPKCNSCKRFHLKIWLGKEK